MHAPTAIGNERAICGDTRVNQNVRAVAGLDQVARNRRSVVAERELQQVESDGSGVGSVHVIFLCIVQEIPGEALVLRCIHLEEWEDYPFIAT